MSDSQITEKSNEAPIMVPLIEEEIPLPKNAREAFPNMTPTEEVEARANTIKLISDISGEEIEPSFENKKEAEELAKEMISNPSLKPEFANYPNETMAYLAGMVASSNCMIVKELNELKLYVVNRFVQEAETAKNSKDRLTALKAIGEIDGVDAFKRKTEVTHITKSGDELEKELRETIEQLKGKVVEGEVIKDD
jgi:hypothetical protein